MEFCALKTSAVALTGVLMFTAIPAQADMTMSDVPTGSFYLSEADNGWYYDVYFGVGTEPSYAGSSTRESEAQTKPASMRFWICRRLIGPPLTIL